MSRERPKTPPYKSRPSHPDNTLVLVAQHECTLASYRMPCWLKTNSKEAQNHFFDFPEVSSQVEKAVLPSLHTHIAIIKKAVKIRIVVAISPTLLHQVPEQPLTANPGC